MQRITCNQQLASSNSLSYSWSVRVIIPGSINFFNDVFNLPVRGVSFRVVFLFQAAAEKEGNRLVHACIQSAPVFFNDLVAIVACFPVYKFHQDLSLVNRKI